MFFSKSVPFLYTIVFFVLVGQIVKKSNKNKEYLKKRLFE